jgi:hypothetical protein
MGYYLFEASGRGRLHWCCYSSRRAVPNGTARTPD